MGRVNEPISIAANCAKQFFVCFEPKFDHCVHFAGCRNSPLRLPYVSMTNSQEDNPIVASAATDEHVDTEHAETEHVNTAQPTENTRVRSDHGVTDERSGDRIIAEAQTPREVLPRESARSKDNAIATAKVCEEFRGEDVIILDLTAITPEFDYFVIATANSRRQMHAMVDEADRLLEHGGYKRKSIEGYDSTPWIVQDYGDVVLHVFLPDARELYDLENLWGDADRVEWQPSEQQ